MEISADEDACCVPINKTMTPEPPGMRWHTRPGHNRRMVSIGINVQIRARPYHPVREEGSGGNKVLGHMGGDRDHRG